MGYRSRNVESGWVLDQQSLQEKGSDDDGRRLLPSTRRTGVQIQSRHRTVQLRAMFGIPGDWHRHQIFDAELETRWNFFHRRAAVKAAGDTSFFSCQVKPLERICVQLSESSWPTWKV